jgi:hypothetical protein
LRDDSPVSVDHTEFWEPSAREHIRETIARYNWSGDALRLDELAHL